MTAHWIVAATKPKAEFIAQLHLERQGYDTYLPLVVSPDRQDPHPMFPNYLFVDTDPMEGLWRPIRSTVGVCAVLLTGVEPSKLPTGVIDLLQRREEAGVIRLKRREAVKDLKHGERVRIHEGSFAGFEAVFDRESAKDCVRVLVEFLGTIVPANLDRDTVSKVA